MLKSVNGEAEHTHHHPNTSHTHSQGTALLKRRGEEEPTNSPPTSHALIMHAGKLVGIMRRDFNISL